MFKVKRDTWILITLVLVTGFVLGGVFWMVLDRYQTRSLLSQRKGLKKNLSKCRQILASKDAQVATDLMKMMAQINGITKRLKIMASFLQRDAEIVAEVKWFVQYSKRLEEQGMIGCTYRRTKRGKLRKCKPKFNISDCQKKGDRYVCPVLQRSVVKRERKRKKK